MNSPISLNSSSYEGHSSPPNHLCGHSLDLLQYTPVFLIQRRPKLVHYHEKKQNDALLPLEASFQALWNVHALNIV